MKKSVGRIVKLGLLCALAAGANYLVNNICVYYLKIPLYLDTIFNAAVCFSAGLLPGLITAGLSYTALAARDSGFHPFVLCSVAEVLLVWRLKPSPSELSLANIVNITEAERKRDSLVSVIARLMLLYIAASLAVSILGGIIDFITYNVLSNSKIFFSAEDAFKIGFLKSNIHPLAVNIMSRIPVNMVDRFIVIFGGYGVAVLYRKIGYNN
jgi:hypothetical protein